MTIGPNAQDFRRVVGVFPLLGPLRMEGETKTHTLCTHVAQGNIRPYTTDADKRKMFPFKAINFHR